MEELMKTKIFKVTVERLLLNGGQTLYMVGWSLLVGTIIGMILALPAGQAQQALSVLADAGESAYAIGEVVAGADGVERV